MVSVDGFTVSANALETVCGVPVESCTWTVKFDVAAVVGVPVIAPVAAFKLRPAGSEPVITVQLTYGGVPPVAPNV
jgi:phosphoribosylcarboxyaminoimidazole (NCAIR) mutase